MERRCQICVILGVFLTHAYAYADAISDLTQRIEELEKQQDALLLESTDKKGLARSFFQNDIRLGGFFESGFTGIIGPNTPHQLSNTSNTLGINISAELSPDSRFVTQFMTGLAAALQNPENDPRATTLSLARQRSYDSLQFGAFVTQGYVEYNLTDSVRIQGGLGYVPFGYAFQQRELVLYARRGGPLLLRTQGLVAPLWSGVHLLGAFAVEKSHWGYDLYSNGLGYNLHVPGVGGRIWKSSSAESAVYGFSTQVGKRGSDTYHVFGSDFRFKLRPWTLTSEIAYQNARGTNPWSVYIEPMVDIFQEKVFVYIHGDYANSSLNQTTNGLTSISDPFRKWEYGAGVNWLPNSFTRLRLGITQNDYVGKTAVPLGQNRDYTSYDVSVGVAF